MTEDRAAPPAWPIAVALAGYAALVIPAAWSQRHGIHPDAVAYARNALYLTQGRLADSVAGYWSPLLSWGIAAGLALGMDALRAGIVVAALGGAALVAATGIVLRRITRLPAPLACLALLLVAETTVTWGATVFPDVLLAAALMAYAATLLHPRLLRSRRLAAFAGALAGLAYLAKAYALPFFLVHFPLSLVLLAGSGPPFTLDRVRALARRLAPLWLAGMGGFLALALPWIGLLSWKYERLTFGTVGAINHAIVGPSDPVRDALWRPVPGRITDWETPETRPYGYWSPFDSGEALTHQARLVVRTAGLVRASLSRFDLLGLGLALTALAPLLLLARDRRADARTALWVAMTWAVYCAGFLPVYYTYRYTTPLLKPLAIVTVLHWAWVLGAGYARAVRLLLVSVVALSFLAYVHLPFRPYTVDEPGGTPFDDVTVDGAPHRALAERLRREGCEGPLASTLYWAGMYVAYHLDASFAGTPAGATPASCARELAEVGVRTLLVHDGWRHAAAFAADPAWREVLATEVPGSATLRVYVPAGRMAGTGEAYRSGSARKAASPASSTKNHTRPP
jgi:hypothetical protein